MTSPFLCCSSALKQAEQGSHQGDCEADIKKLLKISSIHKQLDTIGNEKIAKELKEYGAWNEEELQDIESNYERILWIACGNIVDETK
jgi:phage host-nuclease inhibitor protein Gam